jgi:hypothetical protein
MRDVTVALTGAGALALVVILPLHDDDISSGPYNSTSVLSVAPHSCNDDEVPQHHWPSLVLVWTIMAPWRRWRYPDRATTAMATAHKGSGDCASTPLIAPCSSAAATVLCLVPHLREQEGGMMRGNTTASRHIARGSGVRRADGWRKAEAAQ